MRIYIRDGEAYYRAEVSLAWARRHDNGALVSCGLTVGKDISRRVMRGLVTRGQAIPVTRDQWNHSGCQSSCVLRGQADCRW